MSEKETYTMTATCKNCGVVFDVEIPKGEPADFSHREKCPHCDCTEMSYKKPYPSPYWQ